MNKDEEEKRPSGLRRPKKPSMKRRASWNDYSKPGLYMVTLEVKWRRPLLGHLVVDPSPRIELSALGHLIQTEEIHKLHQTYPNLDVCKLTLMPDHIHVLIIVRQDFPEGKTLGNAIGGFKGGCRGAYRRLIGDPRAFLFEEGYNDSIIYCSQPAEHWISYMNDNPRRLAEKQAHREYFTVRRNVALRGMNCQMVGNVGLLDAAEKVVVIVHRTDTDAEYATKCRYWLSCAERGAVLVSAAVAGKEKAVIHEAQRRGHPVILLRKKGFPEYYKPYGKNFDSCARGLLLEISPYEYYTEDRQIKRHECETLNALAEAIATLPRR